MAESTIIEDKLLPTPIKLVEDGEVKTFIEDCFGGPDSLFSRSGWGIIYCQDLSKGADVFLCSNWASWRARNAILPGKSCPKSYEDMTTTDYDVKDRTSLIATMELADRVVECDHTDEDRMLILWSVASYDPKGPDNQKNTIEREMIGHVSVKPAGQEKWESKLSTAQWVIVHDELAFEEFTGGHGFLRPAAYYKLKPV